MKILIADDDDFTMELLKRKIQNWGYEEIECLSDGNEALKYLQERREAMAVIMDWVMPGINGNEIFLELKNQNEPPLYKILLTAKNTTEDMHYGLNCGAHNYLTKPIQFDELQKALEQARDFLSATSS